MVKGGPPGKGLETLAANGVVSRVKEERLSPPESSVMKALLGLLRAEVLSPPVTIAESGFKGRSDAY